MLTIWLGQDVFAGRYGLPPAPNPAEEAEVSYWMSWAITGAYFAARCVVGGLFGLLFIRPINAVLGWLFRGFNRLFDQMTVVYGRIVGHVLQHQHAGAGRLRGPAGADLLAI